MTFNDEEKRKDGAMSRRDLPGWWAAYQKMDNRVRAEFLLLSGSRWEHLDVAGRRLHIPMPKGGKARAYDPAHAGLPRPSAAGGAGLSAHPVA